MKSLSWHNLLSELQRGFRHALRRKIGDPLVLVRLQVLLLPWRVDLELLAIHFQFFRPGYYLRYWLLHCHSPFLQQSRNPHILTNIVALVLQRNRLHHQVLNLRGKRRISSIWRPRPPHFSFILRHIKTTVMETIYLKAVQTVFNCAAA